MLFVVLKFLHVLAAIVAVGFNASYGLLIGRARAAGTDDRVMRFALFSRGSSQKRKRDEKKALRVSWQRMRRSS